MHKQEPLAVVAVLKAWRIDLLGVRFCILTNHDTLKHFKTQSTLSKRQAHWTETLAEYNYELSYILGKLATVEDPFASQLQANLDSSSGFSLKDGLFYSEDAHIVVPKIVEIRKALMHDADNALGHLGPRKLLRSLLLSFYWPRMARDVLQYVTQCNGCQQHKSGMTKRAGRLHPLPIPPRPFPNVALDFV